MKARGELMKVIASELIPKIDKKGICFTGLYSWTMPKYQNMGLSKILLQIAMEQVMKYCPF